MSSLFWFLLGQVAGIGVQVGRWVDENHGWGVYFKDRRHQGRHFVDAIFSIMFFIAWGEGMLASFAGLFGAEAQAAMRRLPEAPKSIGSLVTGFALCFVARKIGQKYLDPGDPPDPPTPPKED